MDDFTFDLVTNEDLLAINQDYPATPAAYEDFESGAKRIWIRRLSDGRTALGFFNLKGGAWQLVRPLGGRFAVRDVLGRQDLGERSELSVTVPVHGCKVYLLQGGHGGA